MQTTIDIYDFRKAFEYAGRENNFSYEGLGILFDYLEQYEVDTGEAVELDVIALCCDFSEMDEQEVRDTYNIDDDVEVDDFLNDNTMVCGEYEAENTKHFVFASF